MNKVFSLIAGLMLVILPTVLFAQKDNRTSPRIVVTQTLNSGPVVTVEYGQPSVKGRTIGVDLEPIDGQLWRTGANEATTFETDTDLRIMGKTLPKGKYSIFTLFEGNIVTVIFNRENNLWGTRNYDETKDVFRVRAKLEPKDVFSEQLTFTIDPAGMILVGWGNKHFTIHVRSEN
jgi:hypothetical protein